MQDEFEAQSKESAEATVESIALPETAVDGEPVSSGSDGPPLRPYPFWDWLDAVLFAVVLVVLLVVTVLISSVAHMYGLVGMAPAAIIAQGVAMGAAIFALSRLLRIRYGVGLRKALHLDSPSRVMLFCGMGLATAVLVSIMGYVLKLSEMDMPMKEFIRTDFDLLVVGIGAVTFGPLFEELIFRGFLQPLFGKLLGIMPGILATALLFALPHGPQYGWHWQHLLVITSAGVIFGLIRWRAASTTASTIAHAAYNLFLVIAAFVQRANGLDS
ncbi:MAG: CPBP family intramembrane metalloprotease [Bryobacterales bacterium]|nr:CPBP family intramembrane metalloprotease [Bryobacterales bacterium]